MGTFIEPYYMEFKETGSYNFPKAITWTSANGESVNSMFKKAKKQGFEGNFKQFVQASTDLGFLNAVGDINSPETKVAYAAYQDLSIKQGKAPLSIEEWYKQERRTQVVGTVLEYGQKTIDILNNLFGKRQEAPSYQAPQPEPAKSNTGLWIGVSLALVAVGVASYFILRDKE